MRHKLGVRFGRDTGPLGGKSAAYKALKSQSDKAKFRKQWAADEFEKEKVKRTKTKSFKKVDASKGRYMSFARIVKEEGADVEATTAATHYIEACLKMQGDWLRFNRMTRRVDYLYMHEEVHELFERSWTMYEEQAKKKAEQGNDKEASGGQSQQDKDQTEGKRNPKRKGGQEVKPLGKKDGTSPADKKGGTPKVVRTEMEEQLTAMNVVKKRYTSVISRATLILDNIAKNPDEWDMGAKCKELQSCFEQVNGLTVSGFARTLLTKDLREVKAAYPQSSFIVESKAFAAALTPAVDKLEKICSAVVNMHVEAMKSVE